MESYSALPAKPRVTADTTADTRANTRADVNPDTTANTRAGTKVDVKADVKSDTKAGPKAGPKADAKPARAWLSPNIIRAIVQLLSVLAFAALLVPYTQYSRMKKENVHETCKTTAQQLYESNVARCDANAARNFSLRGGVLGLSWLEIAAIMGAAFAWQYLVKFLQGWAVDAMNLIKNRVEERK